ncbi:hypothetical protein JCM10512_588 [Bacteroides reticulotermitis JCM 10512]|uniref:Uncharacterized protein n=1 Tax=Bacteroides reticulotermitis JCM 10512 TaxID=1445607 RepID=W4UNI5_9BACE|nr:hypothetical protein JCM10512_588 [Bacteroides reticulotermitis JCM 10512]
MIERRKRLDVVSFEYIPLKISFPFIAFSLQFLLKIPYSSAFWAESNLERSFQLFQF